MCIMGFDNISELDEMDGGNKIITVEQNFFELGVKAGETVLREINGEMPGIKYIVPYNNYILELPPNRFGTKHKKFLVHAYDLQSFSNNFQRRRIVVFLLQSAFRTCRQCSHIHNQD